MIKSPKKSIPRSVWPDACSSAQVNRLKSDTSHAGLFTGMEKFIMKFNKETGKTAKLVRQSG